MLGSPLTRLWRFLTFYLKADTVYALHSPFVFNFVAEVIENKTPIEGQKEIEAFRKKILKNSKKIKVTDFGAGSKVYKSNTRSISQIAASSASPPLISKWLANSVQYFKAKQVLEFGTSIGIGSLYLSNAAEVRLTTLEGCPEVAKVATSHFELFGKTNISLQVGRFQDTLPAILNKESFSPDLIYFDGNHQEEAVLWQFESCLKKATERTVFVFDDIYWSKGMMNAWDKIKQHDRVRLSLDLFFSGYIFIDPKIIRKQHYKIVAKRFKPWQTGIRILHPKL